MANNELPCARPECVRTRKRLEDIEELVDALASNPIGFGDLIRAARAPLDRGCYYPGCVTLESEHEGKDHAFLPPPKEHVA